MNPSWSKSWAGFSGYCSPCFSGNGVRQAKKVRRGVMEDPDGVIALNALHCILCKI